MTTQQLINAIVTAAEPIRLQIIRLLAIHGELCAKDILPAFDITQPTLSHHMTMLEESGIVSARRHGRCVYYTLNKKTFTEINNLFKSVVEDGGENADSSGSVAGKKTVKVEKSGKSVGSKSTSAKAAGAKSTGAKSTKSAGAKSTGAKSTGSKSTGAKSGASKVAKEPAEDPKDKKKKDKKKKEKDKKKKK